MMDYREPFHALADAGRYEEALAYLQRFYGHAFEEPFYFANMGWLCNQLHDHEGAFGYLMTGIRLFPDDGWMHAQLGMTQNRRERYAHALVCLEDALSLGFDEPWVHYELFLAHRELRQEEEAINAIEDALLDDPEQCGYLEEYGSLLLSMDRLEEAREVYMQAYRLSDEPYYLLMQAECLEKLGDHHAALDVLASADDEELSADICLHEGICRHALEDHAGALACLQEAQRLGRDDTLLFRTMGSVFLALHERDEADRCFARALSYYRSAFDLNDDHRWLYQEMIHIAMRMQDPSILEGVLQEALAAFPEEGWIRLQFAGHLSDSERYEEALALIEGTDEAQYGEEFDYLRAYVLGRLNRHEEALALLEQLQQRHPDDPWLLCECGWNLIQLDAYRQAEHFFQQAAVMHPDPYCEAMLGWCELQRGNRQDARQRLLSALAQGFDEEWIRKALEQCQAQENG